MAKTEQAEDADIKAAISAVAAYEAARYKRELLRKIAEDIEPEITQARMAGDAIDTSDLFVRLAEKYVA